MKPRTLELIFPEATMTQVATGSHRRVWSAHLGQFVYSLDEIGWMLGDILVTVFKESLTKNGPQ